ncbi:HNH endonuclease [Roseomonas sp. HF4]|uniref:HNH endonuclease n=1 Tax=Roseomonas sp. HF4 TaxID=2562313 RepID=UPI003515A77A
MSQATGGSTELAATKPPPICRDVSMPPSISRLRRHANRDQNGCCFYCGEPLWEPTEEADAEFARRIGLTRRQARRMLCTAEHLHPRCDGGRDTPTNIVAACLTCNRRRHAQPCPPDWKAYRRRVRSRLALGKWHASGRLSCRDAHTADEHYDAAK